MIPMKKDLKYKTSVNAAKAAGKLDNLVHVEMHATNPRSTAGMYSPALKTTPITRL